MKANIVLFVVVTLLVTTFISCEKHQIDLPPVIELESDTIYSAIERIDYPALVEEDDYYINDYSVLDPEDGDITSVSTREYEFLEVKTMSPADFFILVNKAGERWGWNSQESDDFYRTIRPVIWKGKQKITVTDSGGNTVIENRLIIGFYED